MLKRLRIRLLHLANAKPPSLGRVYFYELKDRLCRRYGTFGGHVMQEIRKECWGATVFRCDEYDDPYNDYIPCGPTCRRCGGTGIFDIRWVRLEIWRVGDYTFHKPSGDTRIPPTISGDPNMIFGLIKHADYGRKSDEACLWLYVLCGEWDLFWGLLTSVYCCGVGWWPLMRLQQTVWRVNQLMRWLRQLVCRCPFCDRGWIVGRQHLPGKCRFDMEIPF